MAVPGRAQRNAGLTPEAPLAIATSKFRLEFLHSGLCGFLRLTLCFLRLTLFARRRYQGAIALDA
jgi:hypothetical protein